MYIIEMLYNDVKKNNQQFSKKYVLLAYAYIYNVCNRY